MLNIGLSDDVRIAAQESCLFSLVMMKLIKLNFSLTIAVIFQSREPGPIQSIVNARVLLNLGDSVTTDHISPAGSIAGSSAAARWLKERGSVPSGVMSNFS